MWPKRRRCSDCSLVRARSSEMAPQAGQVEEPVGLQSQADARHYATIPAYLLAPQIGPLLQWSRGESHNDFGCAGLNLRELIPACCTPWAYPSRSKNSAWSLRRLASRVS